MTDPWHSAKITRFEHAPPAAGVALLRIEAKGSRWRSGDATAPPVLLADDGERVSRFAPLPAAPDERGTLRVAYSVPADAIAPQTVFSLRLADGSVLSLPRPTTGTAGEAFASAAPIERPAPAAQGTPAAVGATEAPGPTPAAEPGAPAPAAETPASGERRSDPLPKLAGLSAALAKAERRAEDARLKAAAAQDQSSALARERDDAAHAAEALRQENERLQATVDELEVWRGELERRLAATTTELGTAATRLRENEQEIGRLRAALADAHAHAEGEGAEALTGRDAEVAALLRAADRVADAARELADARARLTGAGPAADPSPPAPEPPIAAASPSSSAPAPQAATTAVDTDDLMRRAAAEANAQAARELAEVFAEES